MNKSTQKPAHSQARPKTASKVRIIGGAWRRSLLPVADSEGLRPTPDRVRETLFNWLGQNMFGWRCLDAFAGSGALGFEAASRGAQQVLLIEKRKILAAQLQANADKLKADNLIIRCDDGLRVLDEQAKTPNWDLIFLDPPFAANIAIKALQLARNALTDKGWVYLESGNPYTENLLTEYGWRLERSLKAGAVYAYLLQKQPNSPINQPEIKTV